MSLFSSSQEPELKNVSVTIQKSLWERIGGFVWGTLKFGLLLLIVIGVFWQGDMEVDSASPYQKSYYDAFYRDQERDQSATHIATIPLSGTIISTSNAGFDPNITVSKNFISMLADAIEDPEIDAVLIKVNSPGGEVFAAEEITQAIEILSSSTQKPVYIVLESMAASGGYYVATSGKKIYAYPETLLGNIGVRIDVPNAQGLLEKVGVEMQSVTSGELKTMGSPFRKMTEKEQDVFAALIDESYEKFVRRVSRGRDMTLKQAKELSDGRIYSGVQGKENGLVDEVVTSFQDLENTLTKELDTSSIQFVSYNIQLSPFEEILLSVQTGISPITSQISNAQKVQFQMK